MWYSRNICVLCGFASFWSALAPGKPELADLLSERTRKHVLSRIFLTHKTLYPGLFKRAPAFIPRVFRNMHVEQKRQVSPPVNLSLLTGDGPLHCNENPTYVFLEKKLRGLSPNFHSSCVCERFLYIPRIGPHIFLQQNRQTDPWEHINRSQRHECGNWDWGRAQFLFWEYLFRMFGIVSLQCSAKVFVSLLDSLCGKCCFLFISWPEVVTRQHETSGLAVFPTPSPPHSSVRPLLSLKVHQKEPCRPTATSPSNSPFSQVYKVSLSYFCPVHTIHICVILKGQCQEMNNFLKACNWKEPQFSLWNCRQSIIHLLWKVIP